jgi:hypothetical protein
MKEYQPKIKDADGKIRKDIKLIKEKTGYEKGAIVEKMLKYAILHSQEIFN